MKLLLVLPLLLCACVSMTSESVYDKNKNTSTEKRKATALFADKNAIMQYNLSQKGDITNLQALVERIVDKKVQSAIK